MRLVRAKAEISKYPARIIQNNIFMFFVKRHYFLAITVNDKAVSIRREVVVLFAKMQHCGFVEFFFASFFVYPVVFAAKIGVYFVAVCKFCSEYHIDYFMARYTQKGIRFLRVSVL